MILEEETFKKFGYYPRDLALKSNKRVLAKCDECGKIRETTKYRYRALCRSCSQKGEGNNNWKGCEIKRICIECGKKFVIKSYDIKYGRGKYCSNTCKFKNKIGENNSNWKGGKVKRVCIECGKEFDIHHSVEWRAS
jgi:DNA-directed RNA polymerase subunit RPC12/RpoP